MCLLEHCNRGYRTTILCFIFLARPNELTHCEYFYHFAASDIASTNSAISLLEAAMCRVDVTRCERLNSNKKAPVLH